MSEDMLVYPTEKVVGVVDDRQHLSALTSALADAGVGDAQVEVLSGETGEQQLDPTGDEHGPLEKAVRTVQKALGDESERLEGLNAEIEAGNLVVQVGLTAEDDDERDQEKYRIGRVLKEQGARDVAFYGKNQIEELQLGA
jgi:predicted amidohydrolase YtcJ